VWLVKLVVKKPVNHKCGLRVECVGNTHDNIIRGVEDQDSLIEYSNAAYIGHQKFDYLFGGTVRGSAALSK